MTCPYLKETDAKLCRISAYRKMIVRNSSDAGMEKCSSAGYVGCQLYREQASDAAQPAATAPDCPYLQQNRVEYCAAAPVQHFIPRNEFQHSRCTGESHRYCHEYLDAAGENPAEDVDAVARLYYSPNHMWLDAAADGSWHAGVDDLLARVLGAVDRVTFVASNGVARPSAILGVNGWDFEMVFPHLLHITACNPHLRSDAALLTSHPYTAGWLFEGIHPGPVSELTAGLRHGTTALGWMLREMAQISEFAGGPYMADGGAPQNVLRQLERDRAFELFHQFFSLARAEAEK